jgi:hypothetical protein
MRTRPYTPPLCGRGLAQAESERIRGTNVSRRHFLDIMLNKEVYAAPKGLRRFHEAYNKETFPGADNVTVEEWLPLA